VQSGGLGGPPSLAELVARAAWLAGSGGRRLLGITGPPGAGKSTLATALADALNAPVIPMDGFHLSDTELRRLDRLERKGAPDTFDAASYVALLLRLRTDPDAVLAPHFDRSAEAVVPAAVEVPPLALVITEGNYLLLDEPPWAAVRDLLDAAWYIEVDESTRVQRLIARFVEYGCDPAVARERVTRGSDARNARLVVATRDRAQLVVRGT
jgi:pantothenate kinase